MIVCVFIDLLKERKILEETVAPLTPNSPLLSSPSYKDSAHTQNSIVRDWERKQVQLEKQMVRKDEEIYTWMHGKMSGGCIEGCIGGYMGGCVERCMGNTLGVEAMCGRMHGRMDALENAWTMN